MKAYQDTILYLKGLIITLEALENTHHSDEETLKVNLGILTEVNKSVNRLIKTIDIKPN